MYLNYIKAMLKKGKKSFKDYLQVQGILVLLTRSEERRVGKECRSRWSPYH